jgi:uncharacterized membrane protein YsdA (DUF1294 family)
MPPRRSAKSSAGLPLTPVSILVLLTLPSLLTLHDLHHTNPLLTLYLTTYLLLINTLTFALYYHDKARSRIAGWRVSETRLHVCELAGGWPAAFVAQRYFQHKVRKRGYQVGFWGIVVVSEVAWVDWWSGGVVRGWVLGSRKG